MTRPPFLNYGDTVAIAAPGRKIKKEIIEASIKILKSWGLNVTLSKNIFSNNHSYFAGSDKERIEDFQLALDDPNVKAIICARGGYGTTRIIDRLNFKVLQEHPKWIVGFSDITALHLKLFNLGYESIHGTMPILFSQSDSGASTESLHRILFGKNESLTCPAFDANHLGSAFGQVVGGNLSLLIDSIGTNSEPDTKGKILILEEIDEYLYKIDRMFTQLRRTGKLKDLAGLAIGHFTGMQNSEVGFGEGVEEIILNSVSEYNFPVGFGFPTGHENPNLAWRNGGMATLEVTLSKSSLVFKD